KTWNGPGTEGSGADSFAGMESAGGFPGMSFFIETAWAKSQTKQKLAARARTNSRETMIFLLNAVWPKLPQKNVAMVAPRIPVARPTRIAMGTPNWGGPHSIMTTVPEPTMIPE